jgi:hypothetical protein
LAWLCNNTVLNRPAFLFYKQGKKLSEAELQGIIATHDLDHNGVFDEVFIICDEHRPFCSLWRHA